MATGCVTASTRSDAGLASDVASLGASKQLGDKLCALRVGAAVPDAQVLKLYLYKHEIYTRHGNTAL